MDSIVNRKIKALISISIFLFISSGYSSEIHASKVRKFGPLYHLVFENIEASQDCVDISLEGVLTAEVLSSKLIDPNELMRGRDVRFMISDPLAFHHLPFGGSGSKARADAVKDMVDYVRSALGKERVSLMAHSYGCIEVMDYLKWHPQEALKLSKISILAPPYSPLLFLSSGNLGVARAIGIFILIATFCAISVPFLMVLWVYNRYPQLALLFMLSYSMLITIRSWGYLYIGGSLAIAVIISACLCVSRVLRMQLNYAVYMKLVSVLFCLTLLVDLAYIAHRTDFFIDADPMFGGFGGASVLELGEMHTYLQAPIEVFYPAGDSTTLGLMMMRLADSLPMQDLQVRVCELDTRSPHLKIWFMKLDELRVACRRYY